MRNVLFFIALQFGFTLHGQNLMNTEWTKIHVERKDGSKVVDRYGLERSTFSYLFKKSTVVVVSVGKFAEEHPYSVHDGVLSIGNFQCYKIDTINTLTLVLTEIPRKALPDDKINRFILINNRFHLNYLIQNNRANFIADTLIQCNDEFSPTYSNRSISEFFESRFKDSGLKTNIIGSFILTPKGEIINISIEPNDKFSEKDMNKFIKTLQRTNKSWILPKGGNSLYFKMDFVCSFKYEYATSLLSFNLHTQEINKSGNDISLKQIYQAEEHFKMGLEFLYKDDYVNATAEFEKCIRIDPIYIDAYYYLAHSYLKSGKNESACGIFLQLKSMGQKQGEELLLEHCK